MASDKPDAPSTPLAVATLLASGTEVGGNNRYTQKGMLCFPVPAPLPGVHLHVGAKMQKWDSQYQIDMSANIRDLLGG